MRLRYAPRAAQDIQEIGAYLHARNPAASAEVRAEIIRHLNMFSEHPNAGRDVGRGLRRSAVPRRPYIIIYRADVGTDTLVVLTIRHASRRPLA